ncbi:Structural maintenance of chromosome protein SMC5/Spr18, SMC superfamily [Trachipleistophora hominis]|uniref:Structural maintenance of chromosomes protein 5 n=1 Tax=Trachipleistophora hominis TaxID=72359 RepID=L7JZF5_TRAHO|nr:Structural maintenance of chromosome protein SMC5/Spr18, SMC superfamily [Trachipleistophora hominis]
MAIQEKLRSFMDEIRNLKIRLELDKHKIEELNVQKAFLDKERENKKRKISKIKTELVKYTTEQMSYVTELPEDIESLEKQIASELAKITFLNADKKVLKDYKEKEKLLNDFHLKELEMENKRKVSNQDINNLREDLINSLNEKVAVVNDNFANFFQKLSFDGKVELETENMKASKWKLNILVRFRKEEQMQQLCSYIQSGGERSVSTIIFLLSLLEATPAPFRLVDEINQGMDSYNERIVHNLLVDLIRNKNSPQFFIVTPKLVDNLNFNDSMRVFIIYAGEFGRIGNKFEECKTALMQ